MTFLQALITAGAVIGQLVGVFALAALIWRFLPERED